MTPTVDVELLFVGLGIAVAVLALMFHSADVAMAAAGIAGLGAYAAWLDRRR